MVSTTTEAIIEAIINVSAGIARRDPAGRLVGITAGALFDNHPEVITGYIGLKPDPALWLISHKSRVELALAASILSTSSMP